MESKNNELSSNVEEFWKNIQLGQWDVAVGLLSFIKELAPSKLTSLLVELILYPDKYSHGSNSIRTPVHLSWLAFQQLQQNKVDLKTSGLPPGFEMVLKFSLLLLELKDHFNNTPFVQVLLQYYQQLVRKKYADTEFTIQDAIDDNLITNLKKFLRDLSVEYPFLAVHICDELENIYTSNVNLSEIIKEMFKNNVIQSINTYDLNDIEKSSFCLHHLNVTNNELLLVMKSFQVKLFVEEDNNTLLKFYSIFLNYFHVAFIKTLEENERSYHLQSFEDDVDSLSMAKFFSNLFNSTDLQEYCNGLIVCRKTTKHIISYILDGCDWLIKEKMYDLLPDVLENVKSLATLVLLRNWDNCKSFEEALEFLNSIRKLLDLDNDNGIFTITCRQLVYQTDLIDWCLQKTKEILGGEYDKEPMVNQLFKQINSSSVLSVLNGANLLKTLKYNEVIELLQKKPCENTGSSPDHMQVEMDNFLCYCLLKKYLHLITAVYAGYIYDDDGGKISFPHDFIQQCLKDIKNNIFKIKNVEYRVEVLENIFSLLFIRSTDLQSQTKEDDIDSDIVEEMSLHSSSVSRSMDSLSTIGDEAFDVYSSTPSKKSCPNKERIAGDVIETLLQEMEESSTETLQAQSIPSNSKIELNFPFPVFLVGRKILCETLGMLDDCLLKFRTSKLKEATEKDASIHSVTAVDRRISKLEQHIKEAHWRCKLIVGDKEDMPSSVDSLQKYNRNVINDMLGSPENLVYLTLNKEDLIQAKQVVKLYSLEESKCSLEVGFIVELEKTKSKITELPKVSQRQDIKECKLGSVMSATQSGKMTFEITEIVNNISEHDYLQSLVSDICLSAVALDLMFASSTAFNICKILLEAANSKLSQCRQESATTTDNFLSHIKLIKSLLHFMTTRNMTYFQLVGSNLPKDFALLVFSLPNKINMLEIECYDSKLSQGMLSFEDIANHIDFVQGADADELEKTQLWSLTKLKEKMQTFLSIFNVETLSELNSVNVVFDYFKSFMRYVDKLATWQATWRENKNNDTENNMLSSNITIYNPFKLFSEYLTVICGDLIFNCEMPPKKLESFTKYIGLNLVNVITENCGVEYLSKRSNPMNVCEINILRQPPIILNDHANTFSEDRSPNIVVEECLTSLLEMVSDFSPIDLTASEVCQMMQVSTAELASVSISSLKTDNEKRSFYINLFNLIYTHGVLVLLAGKADLNFEVDSIRLSVLLQSPFYRLLILKLFSYNVGELGIINAFDVYFQFICQGKCGRFFSDIENETFCQKFTESYLPAFDARCLFGVSFGTVDSPEVKVLHANTLENVLQLYTKEFFQNHFSVNAEEKEIYIPEFIIQHLPMFTDKENNTDINYIENNDLNVVLEQLLTYPYLPQEFSENLNNSFRNLFTITIQPTDWSLRRSISHKSSYSFSESQPESPNLFPVISDGVSTYLQSSYPIIGSLIEIALSKSQLVKDTNVVFNNNLLSRENNKQDSLDLLPSLQHSLSNFTKICSNYKALKNFVLESSSLYVKYIELIHDFQGSSISNVLLQDVYQLSSDILSKLFLLSLSPEDWIAILPAVVPTCLHIEKCHVLLQRYQECISFLPAHVSDLLLTKIIGELSRKLNDNAKPYFEKQCCHQLKMAISLIKNVSQRSQAAINCSIYLPTEDAKEVLLDSLLYLNKNNKLYETLHDQFRKIRWLNKVSDSLSSANQMNLLSWQHVNDEIVENPQKMVDFLNKNKEFNILEEWRHIYPMPDELLCMSTKSKIDDLLMLESTSYIEIQTILDHVPSKELSLNLCENILKENEDYIVNVLFILQYLTNSLAHLIDTDVLKKYLHRKLVIIAIETIPKDLKESFLQLRNDPIIVFEQLILNLKINIAKDIIAMFRKEAALFPNQLSSLISECNELLANYAKKSITIPEVKKIPLPVLSQSPSKSSLEKQEFTVPLQSVDKRKWTPDGLALCCMVCTDPFNMFNRRHHCRHCGRVVCAACSSHFSYIERYKRKERVCTTCFQQNYMLKPENSDEAREEEALATHRPLVLHNNEIVHILSNDIHYNKTITADFIFEQSPSASLCVSLIDLHSNARAAGGLLLQYANLLSNHLKTEDEREVDLNMITGMIKFMLKHAKLKFMKMSDFNGVELCDANLARVDILILLLSSNWHDDIPTMQELTRPDALRRIRDKLMENEQYSLAIEITSKCGLDATPVLFRMAITRLKFGELKKAREMFSRCLTTIGSDTSRSFSPNSHYLDRIVEAIENSTFLGSNHVLITKEAGSSQQVYASSIADYFQNTASEYGLDKNRFEEIYFYLTTYGGHNQLLTFLVRYRLLAKAVTYIKEMKCTADTFITTLLLPSFQEGFFTNLCEHMRLCDASLRVWQSYLEESCKYLSKNNLYHCLYEVQLFIKDYFRAALTCVRFYLGAAAGQPATCFGDLHRRISYLEKAKQHLENLLKERNSRSSFVSHIGPSFLNLERDGGETPTHEIKRHSSTINLQLSVMEYLYESNYLHHEERRAPIPTLFGNGKERAELTIQLLLISVEDSLSLASRIIQEFKLPSSAIFGRTCKRLASMNQLDDISKLLKKIEENGMITSKETDEISLAVIKVLVKQGEVKSAGSFVKLIKSEINKINALIICRRLRDAYIEAVKNERVTEVQRILDEAKQMQNQKNLVDICEKWLRMHLERQMNSIKS